jgi:hypothetical protein
VNSSQLINIVIEDQGFKTVSDCVYVEKSIDDFHRCPLCVRVARISSENEEEL